MEEIVSNSSTIWHLCALGVAAVGAFCDWKWHKIFNKLTFSSMLLAILLHLLAEGLPGALTSLGGIAAGFLTFLLFAVGALKAGDTKLYMAIGAFGGWRFCLNTILYSILIGGALALILMLLRKAGRTSMKRLWLYFKSMIFLRKFYMYEAADTSAYFCFGGCILAGAAAACCQWLAVF